MALFYKYCYPSPQPDAAFVCSPWGRWQPGSTQWEWATTPPLLQESHSSQPTYDQEHICCTFSQLGFSHKVHIECISWDVAAQNANSQWVYEHLHRGNEEEYYDAAAEGCSAPLFLLRGVVLLQLRVHKTQWHGVDLVIFYSARNRRKKGRKKPLKWPCDAMTY